MPFARASELDRLLACPGSLLLPHLATRSAYADESASWGTFCHSWKETGEFGKGRSATTLRKKVKESGVKREELWAHGLHEVPVAYNVLTREARALVVPVPTIQKNAWKASHGPEWITGTADYVGQLLDLPWVDDLKTGRRVEYDYYKYQQGFYTMAWTLFSMHSLTPARSTLTHWPKYPVAAPPLRFGYVLEPEDMLDLQSKLEALYRQTLKLTVLKDGGMDVTSHLVDGPQCLYCPAKPGCAKGLKYE